MDGALKILTYTGYWKPPSWDDTRKGRLYDFTRVFLLPIPICFVIGQLLHLALETEDLDEAIETLYLLPSAITISCKALNVFLMRQQIIEIIAGLQSDFAEPMDSEEEKIIDDTERFLRHLYVTYVLMVELIVLTGLTGPVLQRTTKYALPVEMWLPYDYTSSKCLYWLTYLMTGFIAAFTATAGAATDINFVGLLISIRKQLELLAHRLVNLAEHSRRDGKKTLSDEAKISRERILLDRHIRHHVFIYSVAEKLTNSFRLTILVQWIVSSSLVSISVYQITLDTSPASLNFYSKLSYVTVILTQLLLLCWFSEQIVMKSQEIGTMILNINWTLLQQKTIKSYLMISMRSSKPIVICSGYFFAFSLETFKAILKVSYSAFSILRDSSSGG